MRKFILYIATAVLLVGCFKEEVYRSDIVLRPMQQPYDGAEYEDLAGVIGYAFDVDTAAVDILSYEDALNGRVTSRTTGELINVYSSSSPYMNEMSGFSTAISLPVELNYVMLLAVDTENEDYAYAYYEVGLNLDTTFITLNFRPWYSSGTITTGDWIYVVPEANGLVAPEDEDLTVVSAAKQNE